MDFSGSAAYLGRFRPELPGVWGFAADFVDESSNGKGTGIRIERPPQHLATLLVRVAIGLDLQQP